MPQFSVIVCTYNRADSLRETLESLGRQVLRPGISSEIVMVDNNSRDHTRAVTEAAALESPIPVKYVFESRQGLSNARNRGIAEASADFLIFTDDDVKPEPDWAQTLFDAFEKYQADCVGGKILPRWEVPPPSWMLSPRLKEAVSGIFAILDRGSEPIVAKELDRNMFYGANMAFRRRVFDQLGLFRADLGRSGNNLMAGEETDVLERAHKAGFRIVHEPHAVVHHFVPRERMNLRYLRRWRYDKARSTVLGSGNRAKRPEMWLIRECARNGLGSLAGYLSGRQDEAVYRELHFWTQLGQITGYFNKRQ